MWRKVILRKSWTLIFNADNFPTKADLNWFLILNKYSILGEAYKLIDFFIHASIELLYSALDIISTNQRIV